MAEMVRPCYLVLDPEHGGNISTRKLVLETAKLNVLTAYSGAEAIKTLRKYPALDGVVVDAAMRDMPCADLVRSLKEIAPQIVVIVVGLKQQGACDGAETYLDSFDPVRLLDRIKTMQGPIVEKISSRDQELSAEAL